MLLCARLSIQYVCVAAVGLPPVREGDREFPFLPCFTRLFPSFFPAPPSPRIPPLLVATPCSSFFASFSFVHARSAAATVGAAVALSPIGASHRAEASLLSLDRAREAKHPASTLSPLRFPVIHRLMPLLLPPNSNTGHSEPSARARHVREATADERVSERVMPGLFCRPRLKRKRAYILLCEGAQTR